MNRMNQQLKKGVTEVVILKLLSQKEMYGYQITKTLQKYPNLSIREGTLYPLLYRLEDAEFVRSKWVTEEHSTAKPKKYYEITPQGKKALLSQLQGWKDFVNEVDQLLRSDEK